MLVITQKEFIWEVAKTLLVVLVPAIISIIGFIITKKSMNKESQKKDTLRIKELREPLYTKVRELLEEVYGNNFNFSIVVDDTTYLNKLRNLDLQIKQIAPQELVDMYTEYEEYISDLVHEFYTSTKDLKYADDIGKVRSNMLRDSREKIIEKIGDIIAVTRKDMGFLED